MKLKFIGFICVVLILLFGAHFVIYEAVVPTFLIAVPAVLLWLKIILGGMTLGFIVLSIVARFFNNLVTKILYTAFSVWLGFFFYLLLASAIYWVIYGIAFGALPHATFPVLGKILGGLAIIISVYGIFQASITKITSYQVTLPQLPDIWKGRKVAFISDIHLGQIYQKGFAQKIVEKLTTLNPDIIFIGGDLFDGVAVDIAKVLAPFKDLHPTLGTYFITGNHEEFGDESKYTNAIKNIGIRVLSNEMVNIDGLQIIGVDYRDTAKKSSFESVLKNIPFNRHAPSILLKHVPSNLEVAENNTISLQLSGHTHRAQVFPLSFISHSVYKGFDYGLHSLKKMQVITSSGMGTWGPPLRVGSKSEIVIISLQ